MEKIERNSTTNKFHATQFTHGRYLVHGKYDGRGSGPCSPPGEWHFHVDVLPDGSGLWTNLDGKPCYNMPAQGEAQEFLVSCCYDFDKVFRIQ
jgi:hypothetical protein